MTPTLQFAITASDVELILHDIATTLVPDRGMNERYVHHTFSHRLQAQFPCLDLAAPHHTLLLHPEWPTFKKSTGVAYAKYRKTNGCYRPLGVTGGDRGAGFIDFAIGPYPKPEIGVEFCVKYGWASEEVTYDFVKILDSRNPFFVGFSHIVIFRDNNLTTAASRQRLENHINGALRDATVRLSGIGCSPTRDVRLIVSEIATHERRHWHLDQTTKRFAEGLR